MLVGLIWSWLCVIFNVMCLCRCWELLLLSRFILVWCVVFVVLELVFCFVWMG